MLNRFRNLTVLLKHLVIAVGGQAAWHCIERIDKIVLRSEACSFINYSMSWPIFVLCTITWQELIALIVVLGMNRS